MILTCPQCQTRFIVARDIIPNEGRKVRCAQCQHIWNQTPVEVEAARQNIPEIIRDAEEINHNKGSIKSKPSLLSSDVIHSIKPFSIGLLSVLILYFLFQFIMTPSIIMGQGLAFHDVTVSREGKTLHIRGEIVNSMNDDRGVPSLKIISLYDTVEGDSVVITPEKDVLQSGESIAFTYDLQTDDQYLTDIKIKFNVESEEEEKNVEGEEIPEEEKKPENHTTHH